MGKAQEQALGTEKFQQNLKYTAVNEAFKNQIVTTVEPVFLPPRMDQLIGFGQVSTLTVIQQLFSRYGVIDKIDLKEHSMRMMGPYDPAEPLSRLIEKLEKGREFARSVWQTISDAMMVSEGITLLVQTTVFNDNIREWRRRNTNQKTWAHNKLFFRQSRREHRRSVTTSGKGRYTAAVQNIYGVPPLPPEKHHEAINDIHTIVQVMQTHIYELEGLS